MIDAIRERIRGVQMKPFIQVLQEWGAKVGDALTELRQEEVSTKSELWAESTSDGTRYLARGNDHLLCTNDRYHIVDGAMCSM